MLNTYVRYRELLVVRIISHLNNFYSNNNNMMLIITTIGTSIHFMKFQTGENDCKIDNFSGLFFWSAI